ncbi:hypothetical protein [Haladaptatus cibarius]|uniref:hypothetical protein n=1 Tax=Haladaptatus cibarius TaxID=453847 RepID=UPI000A494D5C|nr:hypothetical protein [Haladaptatus cibarius]
MNGVLTIPEWVACEYTGGDGSVSFDPLEELEKSEEMLDEQFEPEHQPTDESTEIDATE